MQRKHLRHFATVALCVVAPGNGARGADAGNLPMRLPGPTVRAKPNHPRIALLQAKLKRAPIFAPYRELADLYIQLGRFDDSAKTLREEAGWYRRKGLNDAAVIKEQKAARYETDVRLFIDRRLSPREAKPLYTGARLEPILGCYIGAFIDRDDKIGAPFRDENFQTHRYPQDFARFVGKPHASYFMYLRYGNKFPRAWIKQLKSENAIPHIAWEPSDLNSVRDDAYLRDFAKACVEMDWPIFIRFASEMNGKWTPYHGNPKLYREKFRLVHRVLNNVAPKVATIWCVNNPPLGNVQSYYPGDDGCDWVGVNFYSVPYYENNPRRPALQDNPLALLDPIYKLYARRKPIAICEYAASHRAALDNKLRLDFATEKMALVYGALPRSYPRVKMINWFSMNTLRYRVPGKTLNDYTLSGQSTVRDAYRKLTSDAYFLSAPQRLGDSLPDLPRPLSYATRASGNVRLSIWAKTYVARPKVYLQVGGKIVYASNSPGAHAVEIDASSLRQARVPVTAFVFDDRNRFVRAVYSSLEVAR